MSRYRRHIGGFWVENSASRQCYNEFYTLSDTHTHNSGELRTKPQLEMFKTFPIPLSDALVLHLIQRLSSTASYIQCSKSNHLQKKVHLNTSIIYIRIYIIC